jgi:hypothetical protein
LGPAAADVDWLEGDILEANLGREYYDVWHDRAVFHFLTDPEDRARYVEQVRRSVKPSGHVLMATFAHDGPQRCSGLPAMRYTASALHQEFVASFRLVRSV